MVTRPALLPFAHSTASSIPAIHESSRIVRWTRQKRPSRVDLIVVFRHLHLEKTRLSLQVPPEGGSSEAGSVTGVGQSRFQIAHALQPPHRAHSFCPG